MKIKELLFDSKEPTVYCESFIYEPSNIEEEKLGHLFMIGRIRNVEASSFFLINLLASRIKREYYNTRHKFPAEAFEAASKEGNKALKENEDRINWLGNLDFIIVSASQKRIHFTLLGKMKNFILRQNEIIDLVGNFISEKDVLFPFSTILQGTLKKNDILIFSTSNIFSKDKLINFGKNLLPIEEDKIKKLIEVKESGVALVVETGKTSENIERLQSKLSPKKDSLPKLPRLPSINKEKVKNGLEFFREKGKKIKKDSLKILTLQKKSKKEEKKEIPNIAIEKDLPRKPKINWETSRKIFSKKITLIVFCALFLIIAGGGIFQYQKNAERRNIEEIIKTAETKKTEGENTLIYGDKDKALLAFEEASKSLNDAELNLSSDEQKIKIENLRKEIEEKIGEISGRKILSEISPIFEIKKGVEEWNSKGMLLEKDNVYIFSADSELAYKWNAAKKEGIFLPLGEKSHAAAIIKGKPIFIFNSSKVKIGEEGENIEIKYPYEDLKIAEIDSFENYFYIFDKEKGEIVKYNLSGNNISSPSLWFKKRESGKEAVSIAIDGNIFLLSADGKIKKYSAGNLKEEIAAPETFPKISAATKIFTSKNNKYLYILEPSQKKVIIIKKTGEVVAEYQSAEFKNLKDLWVNSGDKIIYLLSENKVFKIEME